MKRAGWIDPQRERAAYVKRFDIPPGVHFRVRLGWRRRLNWLLVGVAIGAASMNFIAKWVSQ